jgi:nicotinamidase-related amidase
VLLSRDKSGFLLVDVQEKLTPHVLNSDELVKQCHWLVRLAHELDVPVVVSEQYPHGLGHTVAPLRDLTSNDQCVDKVHFSCYREPSFVKHWQSIGKNQVVIAGIETHVCVMQTAIDMNDYGLDVFVVVNAVSSRHEIDHKYGLKRMKQAGIHLVTAEMVFFEWVGQAGTPEFKALSQSYLR